MPIITGNQKTKTIKTPQAFYGKELTGRGGKTGVLNEELNTLTNYDPEYTLFDTYWAHNKITKKEFLPGGQVAKKITFNLLPVANIADDNVQLAFAKSLLKHSNKQQFVIAEHNGITTYAIPVAVTTHQPKAAGINKIIFMHVLENGHQLDFRGYSTTPSAEYSYRGHIPQGLIEFNAYNMVDEVAKAVQEHADKIIVDTLSALFIRNVSEEIAQDILNNLNIVDLSFHQNVTIWEKLTDLVTHQPNHRFASIINTLIETNPQFLMLKTVTKLDANKDDHTRINIPDPEPETASWLTVQQRDAVKADGPFTIIQAGAGTGKSTTIMERIKFMIDCGIDPKTIRVVSLTNVAADNITEKSPLVQSSTIASYINDIYNHNITGHNIVDEANLIDHIDLYAKNMPYAEELQNILRSQMKGNDLNHTPVVDIRNHLDDILAILNKVGLVTLSLQSYISYIKMDDFEYEDAALHFIVDETQDNNIFEFVYLMNLVAKRKGSFYIVGDASQTLYEFRGASSLALNVIENIDAFCNIKLETNYRSNQDILNMANLTLSDIEVNQFANIQLETPDLDIVTDVESLKSAVKVAPFKITKMANVDLTNLNHVNPDIETYLKDKLDKGEKVAILTYARRHVEGLQAGVERFLAQNRIDAKVGSIMPPRAGANNLLSQFFRARQRDLSRLQNINASKIIDVAIEYGNTLSARARGKKVIDSINKAHVQNQIYVHRLEQKRRNGLITDAEFLHEFQTLMLNWEIRNNSIQRSLKKQREQEMNKPEIIKNSDIIFSTVHSAKGLEFDNVIYLVFEDSNPSESDKRMHYVALTRAIKSELIVAGHTLKNSTYHMQLQNLISEYESEATA